MVARKNKRKKPSFSYLKLIRVLEKDQEIWTTEEREFHARYVQVLSDVSRRVPGMCERGRPDALLLAIERCRIDSKKLKTGAGIKEGACVLASWLVQCLRVFLVDSWKKGMPGERGKRSIDRRVIAAFTDLHRYSVVEDLRDEGMSRLKAVQAAPDRVSDKAQAGSEEDFRRSHNNVSRDFANDPDRFVISVLLVSVLMEPGKAAAQEEP